MTSSTTKKTQSNGKKGIVGKRLFNGIPYFSNMRVFSSKEIAYAVANYVKKQDKNLKIRSVLKKNGVYLYYDEESFEKIKNSIVKEPDSDEMKQLKIEPLPKSKKKSSKKSVKKTSKKIAEKESTTQKSQNQSINKSINKSVKKSDKSNNIIETSEDIVRRGHNFPSYLISRLSKESQGYLRIGLLEIEQSPKKKLQKIVEKLRAEQILFDVSFEKEKPIVEYIHDLSNLVNKRIIRYEEEEADEFIQKFIRDPMGMGKFDKIIGKIEKKGIDEVAYQVFKTIKSKAKKFPRSETILISKIKSAIQEKIKLNS